MRWEDIDGNRIAQTHTEFLCAEARAEFLNGGISTCGCSRYALRSPLQHTRHVRCRIRTRRRRATVDIIQHLVRSRDLPASGCKAGTWGQPHRLRWEGVIRESCADHSEI